MSKKEGNNKDVNTAQGLEKKFRELHVAKLPVAMTQWPFAFLTFIYLLLFYFILIYFTYFLCYCCFI